MISSLCHRAARPLFAHLLLAVAVIAAAPAVAAPGTPLGPAFQVAVGGVTPRAVAARSSSGAFVVLYQTGTFDDPVMAQLFRANGNANGAPIVVVPTSTEPVDDYSVGMDAAGNFVVAWTDFGGGITTVKARRFSASGVPQGAAFLPDGVSTSLRGSASPAVAMNASGAFVIAWLRSTGGFIHDNRLPIPGCLNEELLQLADPSIAYRRYAADGTAQGQASQIVVSKPGLALDADLCLALDVQASLSSLGPYGGTTLSTPVVSIGADGDFAIAWTVNASHGVQLNSLGAGLFTASVSLQRYTAGGVPAGLQQLVQDVPAVDGIAAKNTEAPRIATGPAGTDLIWNTEQFQAKISNVDIELLSHVYGPAGLSRQLLATDVGGGVRHWSYSDYLGDVAALPSGSVVVWRSTALVGTTRPQQILAQRLDANGAATGAPIVVADSADGDALTLMAPAVTADASGNFAVFWSSSNNDESQLRLYGRLYSGQ